MLTDNKGFLERSELDILVPQDTEVSIENLLAGHFEQHGDVDSTSVFGVGQRSLLYFDEKLSVYTVLRIPYQDESRLKLHLAQISFTLEARAHGSAIRSSVASEASAESSPSRSEDIIWSSDVDTREDPIITIQENDEQDSGRMIMAVWRTAVTLNRPRIRLQSPVIVFRCTAIMQSTTDSDDGLSKDPYMESGAPAPLNLLEPLSSLSTLRGGKPRLSALSLSRAQALGHGLHIPSRTSKISPPRTFRAIPAISSRTQYTRSNSQTSKLSVVASLNIETSPFSNENIEIIAVDAELPEGSSEDLVRPQALRSPLRCRPRDTTVFLFRLSPNESLLDGSSSNLARTISVKIHAVVMVSESSRPQIQMHWKTGVDFSKALNPMYGTPGQSMQRSNRPNSLPVGPSSTGVHSRPTSVRREELALNAESSEMRQKAVSVGELGVTVSFTSPRAVRVGKAFAWNVLVLNGSTRPRRLAVTVIPKRNRGDVKGHLSKPSSSSVSGRKDKHIADAVVDENVLYVMQKHAGKEPEQVVSLSTDIRIGSLNPGSCLNAELKLLALTEGHLQIDAVRITDLASNDYIDVRDLPDILAENR